MTTPTDTAKLADEIEGLAKDATPGRWGATPAVPGAQRHFYLVGNRDANNCEVDIGSIQGGYYSCAANAALIVALVNNAPTIIAALRELDAAHAREAKLREALEPFAIVGQLFHDTAGDTQWREAPLFYCGTRDNPHSHTLTGKAFDLARAAHGGEG